MNNRTPHYITMLHDLPSDTDGYTINLGQHRKGWDVFICDANGVPVVVKTIGKMSEEAAYQHAKDTTAYYFQRTHEDN